MGILTLVSALLLAAAPSLASTVSFSAVGDIRLDGPVGEIIASGTLNPAEGLAKELKADIVFGNLECSLTDKGEKQPKTWNFKAPPGRLKSLQAAGFNILSIANNHTWDYGATGFLNTLKALSRHGIPAVGGGKDRAQAEKLHIVTVRGLRVGFLAFTSTFPQEAWARKNKPGVAYSDFGRFPGVVSASRDDCDVLIVSFHGGTELAEEPNEIQEAFAHAAVDSGADLVIGHHPHVLQEVEIYKDKPILYSIGNFLFVSPTPSTRVTVVVRAQLSSAGVDLLDFIPVDTRWGRPVPADEAQSIEVLGRLNRAGALDQYPARLRLVRTSRIR